MPPAISALLAPGRKINQPAARPITKPYFVILGTIEPRKNHLLLLQIWSQLVEKYAEAVPQLVVIGQRGWKCEQVIDLLDNCQQLKNFVLEHAATDSEVVTYLHHAQALLFPTFAEGYGLPLIEALTQGTPVIASDLPVFREIAGEVPEYLDPLNGIVWLEMIMEYAKPDSVRRGEQLKRIALFEAPTWADHFEKIDSFLNHLCEVNQT
jgi:glycosyltransferase involved in cell wall biosynthesis